METVLKASGGHVLQIEGPTALSVAVYIAAARAIADARPSAFIAPVGDRVLPEELCAAGLDLNRILFVEVADDTAVYRATDMVARCGWFATLVVIARQLPGGALAHRLAHICRRRRVTLLLVGNEPRPIASSAVALHLIAELKIALHQVQVRVLRSRVPRGGISPMEWLEVGGVPFRVR